VQGVRLFVPIDKRCRRSLWSRGACIAGDSWVEQVSRERAAGVTRVVPRALNRRAVAYVGGNSRL